MEVWLYLFALSLTAFRLKILIELLDEEIGGIAKRIGRKWQGVALRTKKFQRHEIEDMFYSRVSQDESSKAEEMLSRYKEMGGTRENLVLVLNRMKLCDVAKKVESGYFIDNE